MLFLLLLLMIMVMLMSNCVDYYWDCKCLLDHTGKVQGLGRGARI